MPMNRLLYPCEWDDISTELKARVGYKCESCGVQCRKPGEPHKTHRLTLTVAHINHTPSDCRAENLVCLCAPCHLRYDAPMKRLSNIARKR